MYSQNIYFTLIKKNVSGLSLLGAQAQSLVGELRSHMPQSMSWKKKSTFFFFFKKKVLFLIKKKGEGQWTVTVRN